MCTQRLFTLCLAILSQLKWLDTHNSSLECLAISLPFLKSFVLRWRHHHVCSQPLWVLVLVLLESVSTCAVVALGSKALPENNPLADVLRTIATRENTCLAVTVASGADPGETEKSHQRPEKGQPRLRTHLFASAALPCPALPCPALPCPALPSPPLPSPPLPWINVLAVFLPGGTGHVV